MDFDAISLLTIHPLPSVLLPTSLANFIQGKVCASANMVFTQCRNVQQMLVGRANKVEDLGWGLNLKHGARCVKPQQEGR